MIQNDSHIRAILSSIPIILIGTLLHFCFEWSGKWPPLALFCAVNESVWEHMKIAFWPGFFYALSEYYLTPYRTRNFWFAKVVGFYLLSILIPIGYYAYTAILQKHYLFIDILLFVFAIFISQLAGYIIMKSRTGSYSKLTLIFLLIIVTAYALFSFFPPHFEIFRDPLTNNYGI